MRFDKILAVTVVIFCCAFFFSCEKEPVQKKTPVPARVSGTILKPGSKTALPETKKEASVKPLEEGNTEVKPETSEKKDASKIMELVMGQDLSYDAKGKIDPFIPLIRKEVAAPSQANASFVEDKPKRPLTPLEKMELSQLKLVAVVLMKNKKIAMVEEATGKGYEVGIGTYMGKNSGQVTDINQNSIIIKEIVKDYKGNRKERFQEIKLHKRDSGD